MSQRTCLPVPNVDIQVIAATHKAFTIWSESHGVHTPFMPVKLPVQLQPVNQVQALANMLIERGRAASTSNACLPF